MTAEHLLKRKKELIFDISRNKIKNSKNVCIKCKCAQEFRCKVFHQYDYAWCMNVLIKAVTLQKYIQDYEYK